MVERQHPTSLVVNESEASPLAPLFSPADSSSSFEQSDQISRQEIDQSDLCVLTSTQEDTAHDSVSLKPCPCYGVKLVGDNVDETVTPTHRRSDRQSKILNYFQLYAVKDRIDISALSEEQPLINPDPPLQELLPNDDDDSIMISHFTILVSRVLVEHIPFFSKHFSDVVVEHIPHIYSSEMSAKSKVVSVTRVNCQWNNLLHVQVPLGVLPKCENKYEDMIEIMEQAQHVPMTTKNIDIDLPESDDKLSIAVTDVHKVLFGGDQLTAKRGRESQRIRCNSIKPSEQIGGLIPTSEDWHTKVFPFCELITKHILIDKQHKDLCP